MFVKSSSLGYKIAVLPATILFCECFQEAKMPPFLRQGELYKCAEPEKPFFLSDECYQTTGMFEMKAISSNIMLAKGLF